MYKMDSATNWSVSGQSMKIKVRKFEAIKLETSEPKKVPRNGHRTVSINSLTVIHVGGLDGALNMELGCPQ